MKMRYLLTVIVLMSAIGVAVSPVYGQTWSKKQLEVWKVIEAQWKASMEKDTNWTNTYLHEKFLGWNNARPMPQDKSSVHKWNRYRMENSTGLIQELYCRPTPTSPIYYSYGREAMIRIIPKRIIFQFGCKSQS